jgi:GNAT superfamily N-acetyltransferase
VALRDVRIDSGHRSGDAGLVDDAQSECSWLAKSDRKPLWLRALHRDKPVGVCGWCEDEFVASLGPVYVRPDRRRFGVGGLLLDAALSRMRKRGIRQIDARYAVGDAAAEKLFTSRGFRVLGDERCDEIVVTRAEKMIKS